ncbi:hypothetical protein B0A49_13002, partial [Cryomyces minteri]
MTSLKRDRSNSVESNTASKEPEAFGKKCRRLEKDREKALQHIRYFRALEKEAADMVSELKECLKQKDQEHRDYASEYLSVVKADVEKFLTLPRELRDEIYKGMYVQRKRIKVSCDRDLWKPSAEDITKYPNWPEDTSRYLNQDFVGKQVAREAAKVFYGHNCFVVEDARLMEDFGEHDYYNSGVLPREYIRHLAVVLDQKWTWQETSEFDRYIDRSARRSRILDNRRYLTTDYAKSDGWSRPDWLKNRHRNRHLLEPLYEYRELKKLKLYVTQHRCGIFEPREIALTVNSIVDEVGPGAAVTVKIGSRNSGEKKYGGKKWTNVTHYFQQPSEEEWKAFEEAEHFDCPCPAEKDCTNHEGHHGWYRALLKDYQETFRSLNLEATIQEANSYVRQKLTNAQEEVLVGHVNKLTDRGLPPTHQVLKNIAEEIAKTRLGEHW